jgi:arylsulfatase A-like enzyme
LKRTFRSRLVAGLSIAGASVGLLAALDAWRAGDAHASINHPNIVVFMMDDDSFYRLKYLNGDPHVSTELLAEAVQAHDVHFVKFDHFYVTTPLCCPSRSSFLTAQYAHNHGVHHNAPTAVGANDGGAEGFTQRGLDESTLATWLHDAGYRTSLIGRYLNGYDQVTNRPAGFVPPGWDDWHAFHEFDSSRYRNFHLSDNGTINYYPWNRTTDANYETDVYRQKALEFLATTPTEQPFFLYFAPSAPHGGAFPALRHANSRRSLVAPRPPGNPAYLEADVSDKPSWIEARPVPPPTDPVVTQQDALYRDGSNCLSSVSEAMVSIVEALATLGRLDDTLIVITNDNGWAFLDHRTARKGNPYEVAERVYCVFASSNPGLIPATGSRPQLVSGVDLPVTLAEIANAPIPLGQRIDGVSFATLLGTPDAPGRDDALMEFWLPTPVDNRPLRQPGFFGLITGPTNLDPNWKYVEYDGGERELYDLANDVFELESHANDVDQEPRLDAFAQRLAELKVE